MPVDDVKELIGALKKRWDVGDMKGVVSFADRALSLSPKDLVAQKYRLRAASANQNWPVVADSALALVEQLPQQAFEAARKLVRIGDVRGAMEIFLALRAGRGAEIAEFEDAADQMGLALLKLGSEANLEGDTATARLYWCGGTQIAPRNSVLREKLAVLQAAALKKARAEDWDVNPAGYVEAWKDVLALDPNSVMAAKKVATAADKQDDFVGSFEAWCRVLNLEPANPLAPARLSRSALQAGREFAALSVLSKFGLDDPQDPQIAKLRKRVLNECRRALRAGEGDRAFDCLSLLMKRPSETEASFDTLRPTVVRKLERQAKLAQKARDREHAMGLAERILKFDQSNAFALLAFARHYLRIRRYEDAARFCERVLAIDPVSPNALSMLEQAASHLSPPKMQSAVA